MFTTGTGASGDILVTFPIKYSSSIISPTTAILTLLKHSSISFSLSNEIILYPLSELNLKLFFFAFIKLCSYIILYISDYIINFALIILRKLKKIMAFCILFFCLLDYSFYFNVNIPYFMIFPFVFKEGTNYRYC